MHARVASLLPRIQPRIRIRVSFPRIRAYPRVSARVPQRALLPLVADALCRQQWPGFAGKRQLCAGNYSGGIDSCQARSVTAAALVHCIFRPLQASFLIFPLGCSPVDLDLRG